MTTATSARAGLVARCFVDAPVEVLRSPIYVGGGTSTDDGENLWDL